MDARSVGLRLVKLARANQTPRRWKSYTSRILSVLKLWEVLTMNPSWQGYRRNLRKHAWCESFAPVHGMNVKGPFAGNGDDHFVVRHQMDVTMELQRS